MTSIIEYLDHWALLQPEKRLCSFLDIHGNETDSYTYQTFYNRSHYLAEYLSQHKGVQPGDRVLLVYPPGLDVIVAFFACARLGAIPVPVYPPTPLTFEKGLASLSFIARDCGATAALSTRALYHGYCQFTREGLPDARLEQRAGLPHLTWITTDDIQGTASDSFHGSPGSILFLQYTSGSTSAPRGVIVSHENVIHNGHATLDHTPIGVSWLPQYHDMGLIGYYLYPVISGGTTYGFSPMNFLKRPLLWLQTLSRVQATYASSPNFGFEYCLREDKVPSDQLAGLDLSALRVLMNAAEPVRAETHRRFLTRFAPYGLRPHAHVVAYGLAENTLAVTHHGRRTLTVDKALLQEGATHYEHGQLLSGMPSRLVSCGRPLAGIDVRIVDPATCTPLPNRRIGEIWVAGQSTCRGYWNQPDLSRAVFGNTIAGDAAGCRGYLRTGDLGFLDEGELFVCGRIKDMIIIHGVNYYPQDIEAVVEAASGQIRSGGVVAFAGNEERETLVVMVEVRHPRDLPDPLALVRAIRSHFAIEPHMILFVPARTVAKTTSGKIARALTRHRWLNGELPVLATHHIALEEVLPSTGLRERLRAILQPYHLTGQEGYTLAEAGIDSLSLAMLLTDIEQLLDEHGAPDLAREVDTRLLQRLTVADFFSLLDQLESSSHAPIAALHGILQQIKQDQNDYDFACMRRDATLEPLALASVLPRSAPPTRVLLTGPTGFFGPFLLGSLLQYTAATFHVLIRASDPASGMDRIRDSLCRARVWTPALDADLQQRVHVVCGDIAQHHLGLHPDTWQFLAGEVQAVIHNAALVNYVLNYDTLHPHNVEGTRELLRFAGTGTGKEFHLISSTIIFGWTVKGELLETDNNDGMDNLDFGYAQTKWVAEQLAFAAARQGLPVRVYRPSFISASTGGVASKDDIAIRLLAFMINHGIAVHTRNQISFLPADIAANNIAAIFQQRPLDGQTLHVTVDDYYNMMDITRLISQEYGYPFQYYDLPDFVVEMKRRCARHDPLYPLLDFFIRAQPKLTAMQHKRYNNMRYREALRRSGTGYTDPPSLSATVSYLMASMLREGLIAPARQHVAMATNAETRVNVVREVLSQDR